MLCRAVLTAVAISCTFSREVIGQGSPHKDQIKDLICVLWLSGMQKEDLDVNMLRKLQRHNVNIDDMSRETLKQQCLGFKLDKDNATQDINEKEDDDENKTTTEFVKLDNHNEVQKLVMNDLKIILSNLRDTTTTSKSIDDKTISDKKEDSAKLKTLKERLPQNDEDIQENISDMIYSSLPLKDKTDSFHLKYDNSQPKLASIIRFWQTFTTTTSSYNNLDVKVRKRISKKIRNPTSEERIHEQNYFKSETKSWPKETNFIKKLLADFIYTSTEPTTDKPTTAPIDLKRLSDQIAKLLQFYPQRETLNYKNHLPEKERKVEVINEMQPDGYNFVKNGIRQKYENFDERYNRNERFERSKINNDIKDSNNNRLLHINATKNVAPISIRGPKQASKNAQREIVQIYQSTAENEMTFEPTNAPNTRITETINKVTIKAVENVITKDYIKEIAENVKAIVLREMRQEIKSAPVTTSEVTTTIFTTSKAHIQSKSNTAQPLPSIQSKSSTAQPLPGMVSENPQQNNTQDVTHVMAKFMELFEQFKSIKDKTEIPSAMKKPRTNVTHQEIISPFNVNHSVPKVVINPFRDKNPPKDMPSLYGHLVEKSPRMVHNGRIQGTNLVQMNPMSFFTQCIHNTPAKPITIQTNSDEIKPLGIPLTKPLTLIHQNIIITTTHPPITKTYNRDRWIDRYEHKVEVNRKDRYKHYSIPSRQAAYRVASKPQDFVEGRTKEMFNQYRDRDGRLSEFKHHLKDDMNPMDRRPYLNEREVDYKTTLEKDAQFDQKFYKDDRYSDLKDDKLFDPMIPYKDERILVAKSLYQRPDSSRYYSTNRDNTRLPYKSANVNDNHMKLNDDYKEDGEEHKRVDTIRYGLLSHNRNSQRFHEKLESVDDWRSELRGDTEDKKVKPVASRLQLPLNTRDQRFDDTHFKNFLKTQQKVNDMLEKILSSKTQRAPLGGPLSVETT